MKLIVADLRALANLPTSAVGRRMTFGLAVGLGLLAWMSWWLANAVLSSNLTGGPVVDDRATSRRSRRRLQGKRP